MIKIKNLLINGKTVLAPLAGITNLPFRKMIKTCGCALVYSEMISAKGIVHNSKKTLELIRSCPEEKPLSIQLFGSEPESMMQAAKIIEQNGNANIIDINFGCSVKKVIRQGAGVALMKEQERAKAVIQAVRQATKLPLTIKIRSGWDPSGQQAFDLSLMAQDEGVDAIAFHPRTALQGFKGFSDWNLIRKLKQYFGHFL